MTVKDKTKETASGQAYKVIGTRPLRPDGVDKVTGKAIYGADVQLPNTLHGAMLRSPHAHARIVSIDTSEAEVMPGVKAVVTAADLPDLDDIYADLGEGIVNLRYSSWKVLAHDKVLYHGHAIAAVAATSKTLAEEAVARIKVEYEVLPPVLDVLEAMKDDAVILHEGLRTRELGEKLEGRTNVASHIQHQRGISRRGSPPPTLSWSANSIPPPFTRATSNRKAPPALQRRRSHHRLVQHPRRLRNPRAAVVDAADPDRAHHRHSYRDRGWLRGQARRLPRAGSGDAVAAGGQPAGEDDHEPDRGAAGDRTPPPARISG